MTPQLLEVLKKGLNKNRVIQGFKGSYLSFMISEIAKERSAPLLVLCKDTCEAEKLCKDISFFSGNGPEIKLYPQWEVLPYEDLSPHPDITSERLSLLYSLIMGEADIIVSTPASLMLRVMPKKQLSEMIDYIATGEEAPFDDFIKGLVDRGYIRTLHVEELGEFSVRGGIVDLFGPSMPLPVRIEFFGDEIESIREFDIESQRSTGTKLDELVVLPAGEVHFSPVSTSKILKNIKLRAVELALPKSNREEITARFKEGIPFPGMEFYLPDFYEELSSFFDYLPDGTSLVKLDEEELRYGAEDFEKSCAEGYEKSISKGWPFPEVEKLYLNTEELFRNLEKIEYMTAGGLNMGEGETLKLQIEDNSDLRAMMRAGEKDDGPLAPLAEKIGKWHEENVRVFFSAHTLGQAERLKDLMGLHNVVIKINDGPPDFTLNHDGLSLHIGRLSTGFKDIPGKRVIIAEEDIFGERLKRRGKLKKTSGLPLNTFGEIKKNDFIVHVDHGIGQYRGLAKLEAGGTRGDYLELEYMGKDRIFLPVDRLNLVQRFAGGEKETPKLDKLGGASWLKIKKRVKKAVTDMAEELIEIYAAREVMEGFSCKLSEEYISEFEAAFEYEETPDQKSAIEDVIDDLKRSRPMDRLVCGDVGYGKTEVAMRASFIVAMEGRQVALLVPTTILAQQHYQTFGDRFKGYPAVIERLTRFCTVSKQKEVLKGLEEGRVDIVIGTHRLIQKDVKFKNLGLVIVDEEQRFGVAHKEKLKKIRKTVDVLTLTATPIPRTLHMSMMGIRDLSIISSPPEGRLAVKTFVTKFDEDIVREAVLRETRRGGQVFFVHNRVQDIENVAAMIKAIVPEAKVAVAHGQMHERELEKVMLEFYEGNVDVLVCTTIIESGLDIPNANTIIINNAQNMGLAQLYQLRGRVGRSKHRAYAYLMVPAKTLLTRDARKRLEAIQEMKELSAGFQLASYDLEIRGAGNIVGAEQSGNIESVGFELYSTMLQKAIAELKGKEVMPEIEPEIKFPCPAFFPEEYIGETNQRLNLYKRFSSLSDDEDLDDMVMELLDRFGPLPETAKNFIELISLKILLKRAMIEEALISNKLISFKFHETAKINTEKILLLIKGSPRKYAITPDRRFKIYLSLPDWKKGLEEGKKILKGLL